MASCRYPAPGASPESEENAAADEVQLSREQLNKLAHLTQPAGAHHNETQMAWIEHE